MRLFCYPIRITSLIIAITLSLNLQAHEGDHEGGTKTWNSYQSAIHASRQSGKPVMLVFSGSDWCSWCQRLDQEVFRTKSFHAWARENVLAVEVDFPQGHALPAAIAQQNEQLKKRFGAHVRVYPTVLFVNAKQQVIGKTGFVEGGAQIWIQQAQSFASRRTRLSQKYDK